MPQDPLDQPASVKTLRQWHREGLMDDESLRRATALVQPASSWQAWLSLELLVAGVALVLSGILFFFAYNWQDMGRFQKLGLIEAALLICVAGAVWKGLHSLGGKILVLVATVMTGVFLAVFGQIYQTGADAYELFVGWAALTVVWVFITRLEALWFLWLVIVETGIVLFWKQVVDPGWNWPDEGLYFVLLGVNAMALVFCERAQSSVRHDWLRLSLLIALLISSMVPAVDVTFGGSGGSPLRLASIPVWLGVTAASYAFFRFARADFACVALAAANAVLFGVIAIGKFVFIGSRSDSFFGTYLVMSLVIIAASAGLTVWLAHEHRVMRKQAP